MLKEYHYTGSQLHSLLRLC